MLTFGSISLYSFTDRTILEIQVDQSQCDKDTKMSPHEQAAYQWEMYWLITQNWTNETPLEVLKNKEWTANPIPQSGMIMFCEGDSSILGDGS